MAIWITQIGIFIVSLIIGTIVLHFAAGTAKIDNPTIGKAFMVMLISVILVEVVQYAGLWYIIGLCVAIVLIKYIYVTTWGKTVIAWIIFFILMVIILVILQVSL
ncbi:MAG: hypothetical protein PVF58_02250 [Candidatus Methanofastidiosia archaeon]|jgi:hypothetical protein